MGYNSIPGFRPDRLAAARRRAGLSQVELAERVNATRAQISNWESTKAWSSHPRPARLRALAAALGIRVDDLVEVSVESGGLAELRRAMGLNQAHLAARSDIPRSTIQALERGVIKRIRDDHVERIAVALEVAEVDVRAAHARSVSAAQVADV